MHAERVEVLRQKLGAQEAEYSLAERDVAQMSAELKAVLTGADPRVAAAIDERDVDAAAGIGADAGLGQEIDALRRARASADREAEADRRLDELKRRMGK
jgi:hypothetical protein